MTLKPKIMERPTKTEELIEEIEQFDRWLSPTLKKYLEEVEEYLDYLDDVNSYLDRINKAALEVFSNVNKKL